MIKLRYFGVKTLNKSLIFKDFVYFAHKLLVYQHNRHQKGILKSYVELLMNMKAKMTYKTHNGVVLQGNVKNSLL